MQTGLARSAPSRRLNLRRREALSGFLWISPWLVGLIAFTIGPLLASLALSFTQFKMARAPLFIGLDNFTRAVMTDPLFWPSLWRTLYYSGLTVPLVICGALGVALLMNQKLKLTSIFRTLLFLPFLTPVIASALLWRWMFQPEWGPINDLVWQMFRAEGPRWIYSEQLVIPSLALVAFWAGIGGSRMIIFLAGLQGVPNDLYEAADIDGAGRWQKFWHVTIPMLSPTIFLNLILAIIGSFAAFEFAFIATEGGPNYGSWFYAMHVWANAFRYFDLGYACALAWMMFVLISGLTYLQFQLAKRWVYYAGERD
jgi:multiple sugar transport system permease protein